MDLIAQMRSEVLKLPLGFIRVIELPLVILTFATTCGYEGCFEYKPTCEEQKVCWSYPFALADTQLRMNACDTRKPELTNIWHQNYVTQSQFFVFTGVMSFLYILAILAIYLLKWESYEMDHRYAMVDFLATAVFALFWFAGSCSWSNGVNDLKRATTEDYLKRAINEKLDACKGAAGCTVLERGDYASLNVSLILGFTMFGLFFANLWFIYKETHWWKSQHPEQQQSYVDGPAPVMTQPGGGITSPSVGGTTRYNEFDAYGGH